MKSVIHGDCLDMMKNIDDKSIDLILCDLPYGTTSCSWDVILPFDKLWNHYKRIIKDAKPIVLFSTQPFTSLLICSNLEWYKYNWIWKKTRPGGFVNARLKPLKETEDICVFSNGTCANGGNNNMPYNPQGLIQINKKWKRPNHYINNNGVNPHRMSHKLERTLENTNYPKTIIEFNNPNHKLNHPTEKPIELCEYLIRTYTKENDLILDNCAGSGTIGIACSNTNRRFILIEKEKKYYDVILKRLESPVNTFFG